MPVSGVSLWGGPQGEAACGWMRFAAPQGEAALPGWGGAVHRGARGQRRIVKPWTGGDSWWLHDLLLRMPCRRAGLVRNLGDVPRWAVFLVPAVAAPATLLVNWLVLAELFGHGGPPFAWLACIVFGLAFAFDAFAFALELGPARAVLVFAFALDSFTFPGSVVGLCLTGLGASTGRDWQHVDRD